jgi:hypothetical protein
MPKVTYTESEGLYQSAGTGVQFETTPFSPVQTINTTPTTVDAPGVYLLSKADGNITVVMPTAASVPGGVFVFRQADAGPRQHVLTGSAEVGGKKVFCGQAGATPDTNGSRLQFPALQNSSVTLVSDGFSFALMAASGSMVIDQA